MRWTQETSKKRVVNMASFEEGLGRVMYVAGALEYERPFLAPLYRFLTIHPRGSIRTVPPYVSYFLQYLAEQVKKSRHIECAVELKPSSHAPRVDAQASAERTGIGGWLPVVRPDGSLDKWFSHEVKRESWPWIYEKDDTPSLVISTLEALAVLMSLKVFYGDSTPLHRTRVEVILTWTDNRGNGSILNKLMTTKFPSSAVVMELAAHLKTTGLKAAVQWAPRAVNKEADDLANGVTNGFNPALEERICPEKIKWLVLPAA